MPALLIRMSRRPCRSPMPREAPVTSATLSERSIMNDRRSATGNLRFGEGFDRGEIVRIAETDRRGVAMNLPHEATQDRARTDLNIRGDAFRRKALDDRLPL